jgi:hypothetical protein
MLPRNHSIDPANNRPDKGFNFFRKPLAYQRPETAQTFRRNAIASNSRMTP